MSLCIRRPCPATTLASSAVYKTYRTQHGPLWNSKKHRFYRLYSTTDKTSAFWYSTVLVNAICWVRSERNDSIHWRTMSVSPDVMLGSNTAYMMLQNTIGSCNNPVSKMPFIVCRDILESFTQACSFEHFVTQLMFTRMTYCPYNLYALLYLYLATS